LDFSFEIHSESEEAPMEKVDPIFEIFKTIFSFKIFKLGMAIFETLKI
jgi:hypothetical protein